MYYGSYPDGLQQRSYLMQGLLATTFVGSLLLTALLPQNCCKSKLLKSGMAGFPQ
ncbi:MAG: hypothetical protein GDA48_20630 [Hormoscilla sp. GM102CHS1]|nr:hypothetical protein [Hormoscilla sp. GM102CHS1]